MPWLQEQQDAPCPGLQPFDYAAAKAGAPGLDIGRGSRQAPRGRGRGNRGVQGCCSLSALLRAGCLFLPQADAFYQGLLCCL